MNYEQYSAIYDAEYDDYREDALFYVKMARKAPGPSLELGCGTGRVLMELARAGCTVAGIDNSPAMLDRLRHKLAAQSADLQSRVELSEGDMRNFELNREFGLIYLPFREFMHLMQVPDQLACLNSIHRHLHPEGRVVINLYDFDLPLIAGQTSLDVPLCRQRMGDYTDPGTGLRVILTAASAYRWDTHSLLEERFYDTLDDSGKVVDRRVVTLTQRWFTRFELQHLFYRTGFRVAHLYGGYSGQSKIVPGGETIWVLRAASLDELEEELEFNQSRLEDFRQRKSPRSSKTRSRK